jgi:hypothetical protein
MYEIDRTVRDFRLMDTRFIESGCGPARLHIKFLITFVFKIECRVNVEKSC